MSVGILPYGEFLSEVPQSLHVQFYGQRVLLMILSFAHEVPLRIHGKCSSRVITGRVVSHAVDATHVTLVLDGSGHQ